MSENPTSDQAIEEYRNRKVLLNETPVDDGSTTITLTVREGDSAAFFAVTQANGEEDEDGVETEWTDEIQTALTEDELYAFALAAGQALAKLGSRRNVAGLIAELADTLIDR